MIGWLRSKVRNRRLARQYPGVRFGYRASVHQSELDPQVGLGDETVILRSSIGRYSYLGPRCIVANSKIGQFCSIAADVAIGSGSHPLDRNAAVHPIFYLHRPDLGWDLVSRDGFEEFQTTTIGSDVWIGTKVVIRDGVTIGHGAVVGAGAVVTRDLEPYGIYAGVPARLVRYRFDENTRSRLLRLAWWNREMNWIRQNAGNFADVDRLLGSLPGV